MASAAEIADALDRLVAAAQRQRAAAAATRADLNATDLLAVDVVRRHDGISPGALAREMHLTPGGANGVIRRVIKAKMVTRRVSSRDRRDVGLHISRRAITLMTTGVGGWDPKLLERLARLDERQASDMMALLDQIAAATEHRAEQLAATAAQVNDPSIGVPVPLQWG
jgi:DNA-binding MarR family transcriptional regulator